MTDGIKNNFKYKKTFLPFFINPKNQYYDKKCKPNIIARIAKFISPPALTPNEIPKPIPKRIKVLRFTVGIWLSKIKVK